MLETIDTTDYIERAHSLIEINRFKEAIPILTKVISEDPDDDWALCSLSMCFSKLGDNEKSLEYAEKAIQANPQGEWGYRLKGILAIRKGNPQECLKYARKAVELEPQSELALGNLVWAFLHNSKTEEADIIADTLLKISPDSAENLYLKGVTQSHLGNLAESVEYFNKSLAIKPDYAEARNALALVILKQSATSENEKVQLEAEGLHHLTDSLKIDPGNKFVTDNIKQQFDNSYCYFLIIYLSPLFLFELVFAPLKIVTLFPYGFFLLALYFQISETYRRRKQLSPELKSLLKIRDYKLYLTEQFTKFRQFGKHVYRGIWLQICITITLCLTAFFVGVDNLSFGALCFIRFGLVANTIWMFLRIFTYTGPK